MKHFNERNNESTLYRNLVLNFILWKYTFTFFKEKSFVLVLTHQIKLLFLLASVTYRTNLRATFSAGVLVYFLQCQQSFIHLYYLTHLLATSLSLYKMFLWTKHWEAHIVNLRDLSVNNLQSVTKIKNIIFLGLWKCFCSKYVFYNSTWIRLESICKKWKLYDTSFTDS